MRRLLLLLFWGAVVSTSLPAAGKRLVVIDQDSFGPGGPNLQPILMVLQDPDVEVLGITVESGDGWQKENAAHVLRMLECIGRTDVPVYAGATFPLINSEEATARWEQQYGKLGYKGAWTREWPDSNTMNRSRYHAPEVIPPLPEGMPTSAVAEEPAASFLARITRKHPGEVTVLALGPLTNVALAARLDEGFPARAKELILMGMSFNPHPAERDEFALQFVYTPRVEFNTRWDPEAAFICLHSDWKQVTVVPLDATTATKVTPVLLQEIQKSSTLVSRYLGTYSEPGFPMWDEVAAAVYLRPSLVTRVEEMSLSIDCSGGPNYGATLSWPAGKGPALGEVKAKVVFGVDVPSLEKLFVDLLRR